MTHKAGNVGTEERILKVVGGKNTIADFFIFWLAPAAVMIFLLKAFQQIHYFFADTKVQNWLNIFLSYVFDERISGDTTIVFVYLAFIFLPSVLLFFLNQQRTIRISEDSITEKSLWGRKHEYRKSDIKMIESRLRTGKFVGVLITFLDASSIWYNTKNWENEAMVKNVFLRRGFPYADTNVDAIPDEQISNAQTFSVHEVRERGYKKIFSLISFCSIVYVLFGYYDFEYGYRFSKMLVVELGAEAKHILFVSQMIALAVAVVTFLARSIPPFGKKMAMTVDKNEITFLSKDGKTVIFPLTHVDKIEQIEQHAIKNNKYTQQFRVVYQRLVIRTKERNEYKVIVPSGKLKILVHTLLSFGYPLDYTSQHELYEDVQARASEVKFEKFLYRATFIAFMLLPFWAIGIVLLFLHFS